jgi:hypothetical protein
MLASRALVNTMFRAKAYTAIHAVTCFTLQTRVRPTIKIAAPEAR